ncbi:reverse transcriptase/maturase family protein [Ferrimonas gelatinilytica]|uniref:Reverse transcriptase/maturase family protein n=1 Tax=Ferrimonas gelatinilytica TaxID=1255257 RepID=A0ABP9S0S4_9GAMM
MNKKKHPWFRQRGYLHFDSPVGYETAKLLVSRPEKVSKHSFYPFINYDIESLKVYSDEKEVVRKKYKKRPIAYAAHLDSHVYAYYAFLLSAKYEEKLEKHGLSDTVLAFRSLGKSNIDFAHEAFSDISSRGTCSAVALDITGFFDNLDHQIMKSAWCQLLDLEQLPSDHYNVFKSITKYSKVDKVEVFDEFGISSSNPKYNRFKICDAKEFRDRVRAKGLITSHTGNKGIPQGSPISALLSNIYMLDFDMRMKNIIEPTGGRYFRYCDDMLFIVDPEMRSGIEEQAKALIKEIRLEINSDKTEIRDFMCKGGLQQSDKPLQYLGFIFDGQRVLLRSASLARFSGRMKAGVRLAKKTMRKANALRAKKGLPAKGLYKKKLYDRYSHLGNRNFITYAHRSAKTMNSKGIKRQLKPLWKRLQDEMKEK